MPWSPESEDPLESGSLSVLEFEASAHKLIREWLAGWFDGDTHVVRTVDNTAQAILFPEAKQIAFQQAALTQPLDGFGIGVVLVSPANLMHRRMSKGESGRQTQIRLTWRFYSRASVKQAGANGHNSESLCRLGSDRLLALLSLENNHLPLKEKGIFHIRTTTPVLIPSADINTRAMNVSATCILETGKALTTPV